MKTTETSTQEFEVQVILPHDLSASVAARGHALMRLVWPPADGAPAALSTTEAEELAQRQRASGAVHFVIQSGEGEEAPILAHARLFRRDIEFWPAHKRTAVSCLAAVCVHPEWRGRGWGRAVAQAAFEHSPRECDGPVLFQTSVPGFYEKLGARVVANRFFNSLDEENPQASPFLYDYAMIHPAGWPWPAGDVDLRGPGF
jgi:predicted N-acetyltransferase YhbS